MLKQLLFLFFLLFLLNGLNAQSNFAAAKSSTFFISLTSFGKESVRRFSQITVADLRFDSTKIGFGDDAKNFKIVQLHGSMVSSIEKYLTNTYVDKNSSLPQLLIVLRNLWLQEVKAGEIEEGEDGNEKRIFSRCIAKLDVFVKRGDDCQALIRIDTLLQDGNYLKDNGGQLLADMLDYSMERILSLNIEEVVANKSKIKLTEVMAYYRQRFETPRLLHDTLQRGIYLTFADFIQKRPKPFNFVLEQDESGDYLYIEEGGEQKLFTEFWGFCDGKYHFIKSGNNFFTLIRDNNAYSFMGCLQPIHNAKPRNRNRIVRYSLFGAFGELHRNRLVNYLRPMQLNMETGQPL